MYQARRFPFRPTAAALVALAASCGLQTEGLGAGDGDGGVPETLDGDVTLPDEATDDGTPAEDTGDPPDTPAVCGNSVVEGSEECDDGNPDDTDACPTTCRNAFCGDGFVRAGSEQCDNGPANSDTAPNACRGDCTNARCGDGVVDAGEECDDGNLDESDGCLNTCRLPDCGNGRVDPGEACDDGDADNTDECLDTCVAASCGDGYLWAGVEECDGDATACTTTCGSAGRRDCTACRWSATCTPPVETCNGTDDDCDGVADNGFACRAGETAPCTTLCGSAGTGTCSAGCLPADPALCAPPAESCNGADDDCDGQTDEGFALFCDLPHDHPDIDLCVDPGETLCNGADDNCNGVTDEGFECSPGTSRPCSTSCGVAGTQPCSGSCEWGGCCAPAEVCQAVGATACDDNCDGTVDEGCGVLAPPNDVCAFATPITEVGTLHGDTTLATHTATPSCSGGSGRDLWYTFTLSGRRILYIDTVDGGAWSTVLELRSGSCTGPVVSGGCNDDACGGDRSQLVLSLPAGTYYLLVDGHDESHFGPFDLLVQASSCSATRITSNGDRDGNTWDDGNYRQGSCGGGSSSENVFYFALCAPTAVTAHTCSSTTRYDTVLYYREGDCWSGSPELGCNDDGTCSATTVGASRLGRTLPKGLSFLMVDGYRGAEGAYRLNISGLP